ncbi:MAG TPA: hypothetical protein VGX24_07370 [Pyrinomonadaceae bacterium]|jgi:hypothetical protein|nr:hypothetical protein [Pyrinomonadaceae bacterium]
MAKDTQTLATSSPAQLERFLMELANLQADHDSIRRFRERYIRFIPQYDQRWMAKFVEEKDELANKLSALPSDVNIEEIGESAWIVTIKLILINLWTEPDSRQKEWGAFAFRYALYKWGDDAVAGDNLFRILYDPAKRFRVPPPTPFEQALSYLVKVGDKARYCANPECPAPYFFVVRKNQRYCSEICAAPAQRELKRKWWAEHGEEWRTTRQQKKPSKRKAGEGKGSKTAVQTTRKGRKAK